MWKTSDGLLVIKLGISVKHFILEMNFVQAKIFDLVVANF